MKSKKIKHREKKELLKNKTEFREILLENTKDYKGKYEKEIKFAPKIYKLLCRLLESKNLSKEYRNKISSTIAYFILPKDIFPEDVFGPKGYVDDIYLCLYLLNQIKEEYEIEELLEYWDESPKKLKTLLKDDYKRLDKDFGYILNDILEYIGLK